MTSHGRDDRESVLFTGREIISLWMGLLRAAHLYEPGNSAITALAEKILARLRDVLRGNLHELHIAVRQDAIFIAGERIRENTVGSSVYHSFIDVLRAAHLRGLRLDGEITTPEIETVGRLLVQVSTGARSLEELANELKVRGATHVELEPLEDEDEIPQQLDQEKVAKHVYLRSIGVVKGVFDSMRKTDRINARRVKRVVQQMIESLNFNPEHLLHLTSLKNYDEYTFNHSVNVAVLGVALARHVGLSRRQLYVVGQAGMLHDLGKLCIPKQLLNKAGPLTREEWQVVKTHPIEGFVSIANRIGVSGDSVDIPLVAYEHHMNVDGSGYPQAPTAGAMGLLSRIIAIVDRYDAMTSSRVFRRDPIPPAKALAIMYQKREHDPALLRYFMNLMGFYPLGTVVRLTDNSIGVVVGSSPEVELRHFPKVKLVLDSDGRPSSGATIDLAATAKDAEPMRVEETLDESEHSIEVMEYIL